MISAADLAEQARREAGKRYQAALEQYEKPVSRGDLLYDPSQFSARSPADVGSNTVASGPPSNPSVDLQAFPKLLAAGVADTMEGHKSYEIAQALSSYSAKMNTLDQELAKLKAEDKTFQGYSSDDLAKAFQDYAKTHDTFPENFVTSTAASSATGAKMSALAATSAIVLPSGAYSWTALLMQMQWSRVIYCIIWILFGLVLLFFGYASFFWLNKVQIRSSMKKGTRGEVEKRRPNQRQPFLSGGVGGLMIGFLFFSYLASVIHNTVCTDEGKHPVSAGAFFAVWLAPGLLGAFLGGYFYFLAKIMAGVLGGTSMTIIVIAMFGVQTMLIRVIVLAVFVTLLTTTLLTPRINMVQKLVLNACTSLIGIVTFLNGVALFAPPYDASASWIDLWTMLFCSSEEQSAATRTAITSGWGTAAFKGYIAGAVIGAVAGFVFELLLHKDSGMDAESEWNEYLGTYTQRLETGYEGKSGIDVATTMAARARAGLFEPAPNAWQRMVDFFDSESQKPAHYGNLSGDGTGPVESLTDRMRRKKSSRSAKTAGGVPARFEALSKRDDFDDESSDDDDDKNGDNDEDDATDVGSDDDEKKLESKDLLTSLPKTTKKSRHGATSPKVDNYRGYSLPTSTRPTMNSPVPSYSSQLSGTTARNSSTPSDRSRQSGGGVGKLSPPPPSSSSFPSSSNNNNAATPSTTSVPATPSLINAITRIQAAQQAAREWQKEHAHEAPYKSAN